MNEPPKKRAARKNAATGSVTHTDDKKDENTAAPTTANALQRVATAQSGEARPADILALQGALGNATTARVLTSGSSGLRAPGVQRHPQGTELPNKEDQVSEIGSSVAASQNVAAQQSPAPPAATRTAKVKGEEEAAATAAGTAFTASNKLSPGAMSLASAEKILQGSYGDFKKIVPGSVVILADQPACAAKYDEVCIAAGVTRPDGSAWQAGDCAKDDAAAGVQTEGFAWEGVVYVNGQTTLVTATTHEILHNNTEPKFRAKVGETFNEGVTETLARKALADAGITVPAVTAYPDQVKLTKLLVDFVGIDVVQKAYFKDVEELVTAFTNKGTGTWSNLVAKAEALDTAEVTKALTARTP